MKRILFITHPESDYGGCFLHDGYCHLLGPQNVFDYPIKFSHHGVCHTYERPWLADDHEHRHVAGRTDPLPWQAAWPAAWGPDEQASPVKLRETAEAMLRAGEFALVVLESNRPMVLRAYDELREAILVSGAKVLLHDGEDYSDAPLDAINKTQPTLVLKREMTFDKYPGPEYKAYNTTMIAFPFSAAVPEIFDAAADAMWPTYASHGIKGPYLCACMMGATWREREQLIRALSREFAGNSVCLRSSESHTYGLHNVQPTLPYNDYLAAMSLANVVVSMRGWGFDTVRYWEAATLSVVLQDQPGIYIPNPLKEGIHCLQYGDNDDAVRKIRWAAQHVEDVQAIRLAGRQHIKQYHTNEYRAMQTFIRTDINPYED